MEIKQTGESEEQSRTQKKTHRKKKVNPIAESELIKINLNKLNYLSNFHKLSYRKKLTDILNLIALESEALPKYMPSFPI